MMDAYIQAVLVLVLAVCFTDVFSSCVKNDIAVQENFDLQKYLGKWYEQKWLAQTYIPDEQLFQDYTHTYVLQPNGRNITAYVAGRDPTTLTKCFHYEVYLTLTDTPGKLLYTRGKGSDEVTGDYRVISTDYTSYALVYGCRKWNAVNLCEEKDSWIWSRTRVMTQQTLNKLETKANRLCINVTMYLGTRQNNECTTSDASQQRAVTVISLIGLLFLVFNLL